MGFRRSLLIAAFAACGLAGPAPASADWLVTPFLGANVGGSGAHFGDFDDFDDEFERRVNLGASLGWMGRGIIGLEADFGWSPNFFENTRGRRDFEFGDSNLTTLMGNVLVGIPVGGTTGGGMRPYAVAGIGLIRSFVDGGRFFDDVDTNDVGFDVGGGIHGFFSDNLGIRGDIRYFRKIEDKRADDDVDLFLGDFDYWRATVGFTFRFGGE